MDLSSDHYLNHLSEVNKHNKIILSQDIYNHHGVLVIKQGAEVNSELTYKVAKHKLSVPIDSSIKLSNSLSYKKVITTFEKRLASLNVLDFVKDASIYQEAIVAFRLIAKYPKVIQKLSILENRLPDVFGRAVASSGMALSLCKELGLSLEKTENVFLATLISDVGLLHIEPDIVNKQGQYTAEEWRKIQGHVAIAKHFTDQIQGIPSSVGRALLEHHERADGFGYPFGKTGDELCIEGQIISIVDKLSALIKKLITDDTYSWPSIIHVMQISSSAHVPEVQDAMMRVLKRIEFPYKPAFPPQHYKILVKDCVLRRRRLVLWFKEFSRIYVDHKQHLNDDGNFKPIALLNKLEYTLANTGLLEKSLDDWLLTTQRKMSLNDYNDIEEFSLLLNEVEYRCLFVMRKFESAKDILIKRFGSPELLSAYHEGLRRILGKG